MIKNHSIAILLITAILLGGCGGNPFWLPKAHKIDIQQGNLISKEVVDSLQTGMTRDQVSRLLGEPVLENGLNPNRWDYLYTRAKAGEHVNAETLSVFFDNDVVSRIENNYSYSANK